jgi:hypothetical protein
MRPTTGLAAGWPPKVWIQTAPEGRRKLVNGPGYLVLRDVELINIAPPLAAGSWVQGDIHGPPVRVYETIDYAGWLVSRSSEWLGDERRTALLAGIAGWSVWPGWNDHREYYKTETLLQWLEEEEDDIALRTKVKLLLSDRLRATTSQLGLPEDSEVLADRLLSACLIEKYRHRSS